MIWQLLPCQPMKQKAPQRLKAAPGDRYSRFWGLRQNRRCPKVWREHDLKLDVFPFLLAKGCWWHVVHFLIKILSFFTKCSAFRAENWSENALYRLIKYDSKMDDVHLQAELIKKKRVCVSAFMKSPLIKHNFTSLNGHILNTPALIFKIPVSKWLWVHWAKKLIRIGHYKNKTVQAESTFSLATTG